MPSYEGLLFEAIWTPFILHSFPGQQEGELNLKFRLVGGGEKGYQFSGREGARCGVTLWTAVGCRKREEADCFLLSQAGLSSLLTSGVR
jgi:hypothetical protein